MMFIFSLAPIVLGFIGAVWLIKESPYYYLHQTGNAAYISKFIQEV
jgi:hypothetical protein